MNIAFIEGRESRRVKSATPAMAKRPSEETILVVDDEPRLRDSLNSILRAAGYPVCCAEGGRQAIEVLKNIRFNLVLLDLNMPEISGQQVLDFMTAEDINTSVVILSGESTFDQAAEAMRKGAVDFLVKPCPPDKLLDTVAVILEKQRRKIEYLQIQQRIEDSRELHSFMINHSPDLIFMLDGQGKFSFINDRSEYFLGGRVDETLGRTFAEFIHADDRARIAPNLDHGQPHEHTGAAIELRLAPRSGAALRHVEIWTRPLTLQGESRGASGETTKPITGTYGIIRDISDRKQAEELRRHHLSYQLYHDPLTNLPNRSLFNDRLQVAIRQARRLGQKLAVMFLDIDRFKRINDSLGHLIGDEVLQLAAQRLRNCLREGDTLARISGDEFNLLLPNITTPEDAATIAAKIHTVFSEPLVVQGKAISLSFSIGCAVYPDHGKNQEILLHNADLAMYQVKERGRNNFHCYSKEMDQQNHHYNNLERGLQQALEQNELRLLYQPQTDMISGRIIGVEALVRWRHPQRGMLLPAEFMPVAQHSELVCRIDDWVLRQACRDAVLLKEHPGGLRMAVNVSPQQMETEGFAQSLLATLDEFDLDPALFEIEVTENSLLQDINRALKTLSLLANRGITITVDNFGRDYSSLSYLNTLPLHKVKIDRSFMKNLTHSSGAQSEVITAILAMARGLGLTFIAKGVETRFQHDYLLEAGCRIAQGNFHSPPLLFPDLLGVLSRSCRQAS
jgi:diguanylate cyclase (GGDEF)-like protein/PAS domain S-box-containing protein